eukprot:gene1124-1285_t
MDYLDLNKSNTTMVQPTTKTTTTTASIDFYGTSSPNVAKVQLMLRALDVPYNYIDVNIQRGDHLTPEFRRINPNAKLPSIVDHDVVDGGQPITVFESGNILMYLANKYGKFLPNAASDPHGHTSVMNWIFWQASNLGPIFSEHNHYILYAPGTHPYSIKRYFNELRRLFNVLEHNLATKTFVASDSYTIADMAIYPWARLIYIVQEFTYDDFPLVFRYLERVGQIPSVYEWERIDDEETAKRLGHATRNIDISPVLPAQPVALTTASSKDRLE